MVDEVRGAERGLVNKIDKLVETLQRSKCSEAENDKDGNSIRVSVYLRVLLYRSRYESATEISGQLKALARALKVPVLCLAQINRENTQRQDKRPQLSDLRDTGALEQDADGVIFLHCPYYYQDGEHSPWEAEPMEIILAKNRHASTGKCDAVFYKAVGRIIPERVG